MATNGIPVNAVVEQRISTKTGEPFWCVVAQLTPNVQHLSFLTPSEAELVKLTYTGSQKVKMSTSSSES